MKLTKTYALDSLLQTLLQQRHQVNRIKIMTNFARVYVCQGNVFQI